MSTALAESPTVAAAPADSGPAAPLGRRWFAGTVVAAFLLSFLQAPGLTVADTKYDLAQNPLGFLQRAAHLWSSQAPMGQVQNQAYGYFFPHGAFFSLGHAIGLPAWATQRIWWALLILAGFWGIVRLCEVLGIGTRGSRVVAALAFALSPRVLTTLGSISSETLPMMLAPWVLLAPCALGTAYGVRKRGARSPAGSALALALMGAVNAVATVAAFLPAVLWWLSYRPNRRWWRFTRAWIPLAVLATFWWVVPLLLLGRVSPPFLDYIESSGVTTQWASLAEVLRGTGSWTPFVSPERIAGAVLVTQPAAVLATGLLAAAGMAGLALRSMPHRGRFALILIVGLAGICAGYVGEIGGPFAEQIRIFLDAGGAPLRNVHKLEPLIRIPLVVGLAHLLHRVPLPASVPMPVWRRAFARPERDRMVAVTALILAALTLSTSLAWTSRLAPRGAYDEVPAYWRQTAEWLAHNASGTRALVAPGAPFGSQIWGLTRDEPLQALASTPWAVRDAVPLTPPGAIRAMDSVQRLIADGRPSTGLAPTLAAQGIGVVVLRNDLDPETSRSTRPMLAHQAVEGSPGLTKVAEFGDDIELGHGDGLVTDGDLRPVYPAVEVYRVEGTRPGAPVDVRSGSGAPPAFPGAYTVPLDSVPVVQGGPEVLERLRRAGDAPVGPTVLSSDAARAGLSGGAVTVTDTPMDREADFGRVDNHASALRAPTDPRRTHNLVPDYPVPGAAPVEGEWSGATVTASGSAADATQLGGAAPGSSTAAAVDDDPSTAWLSNSAEHAVGQWIRLDLDRPIRSGSLQLTTSPAAIGDPVKWMEVRTANGTVAARVSKPGAPVSVSLPPGRTDWVRITAIRTEGDSAGGQFGISELGLTDYSNLDAPVPVDIRHRTVLPPPPAGAPLRGWSLGQEFPGRGGCFDAPERVRCSKGMALFAEEPSTFQRTLSVPGPMDVAPRLTVRTRQGPALESLLTDPDRPIARGEAEVGDLRGSAFAATDGDPRTSWTAPEETVRTPDGPKPTLTLELPRPTLVDGLDITTPRGDLPARPTSVAVNLGDGPQVREIDADAEPGSTTRIPLHPRITDHIELSIDTWKSVLDRTALGITQEQPPGLAEVSVLGPDYPPPAPLDRPVTVDCEHGPTVAMAGKIVHTTVTATADELRSGAPVSAQVCGVESGGGMSNPPGSTAGSPDNTSAPAGSTAGAAENDPRALDEAHRNSGSAATAGEDISPPGTDTPISLPAGRVDVTTAPTDLFSVDELRLDHIGAEATPMAAPPGARLLVLPLSTNVGWVAHTADGRELRPVVADGWEQAWLLPPDAQGPITVEFPTDRWYRLAIFGGLLLVIPLVALAVPWPGRRRPRGTGGRIAENGGLGEPSDNPPGGREPDNDGPTATADHPTSGRVPENDSSADRPADRRESESSGPGEAAHRNPTMAAPPPETHPETTAVPADSPPRPWKARILGMIGLALATLLIAGPIGFGLTAAGLIAARFAGRIVPRALVVVAGAGTVVSMAALSTGPWRSPDGYMGGSVWVQLPALLAVIAVGIAALPSRRDAR
ncbi:alpha-(1-_3)-arabinofuranosyltransferase [Nocardia sp. BMG51109]|uniref:alpha-(1->3)-arabinofuranosyltransferase n=1 Tax=Nocardia sp. BMG51109 TaxID=1056816 RepID=UPI0004AF192B|nr:alpha-(1->3)-arabinofuranosyltransferase [Nocardia sp. BMG51109]